MTPTPDPIKTIELFAGTKSFSKVAQSLGFNTFTFDNDPKLDPDCLADIMQMGGVSLNCNVLWASPPCTTFSVASIRHYWTDGRPKNEKALYGIAMLEKTIEIIANSNLNYWFIENPRGMMRKVIDDIFAKNGITDYVRRTVSYCQYGAEIMKPTDIWTNNKDWTPRPICKPGADCHQTAGRGAKTGVQGIYNLKWEKARGNTATARGVVPEDLFKEIFAQLKQSQTEGGE